MMPSSNSYGQIQSSISQGQIQGGQGDSLSNIQAHMIQPLPYSFHASKHAVGTSLQQMNIEQEEAPAGKQRSRPTDLDVVIENHSQRRNQFQSYQSQVMQQLVFNDATVQQQVEQIASNHKVRRQMKEAQNQGLILSNGSSQRAVPDEKQQTPQVKEGLMARAKQESVLDDGTFQNKPNGGQNVKANKAKQLHAPYLEQVPQYSEMQSHEHAKALEQVDAADVGEDSKAAVISISIQSEEPEEDEVLASAQTTEAPNLKQGSAEQQLQLPMTSLEIAGVISHASSESSMVHASQVPMPIVGQLSQQARALKDSLASPTAGQENNLTASPGGRNSKHSSRRSHHTKGTGSPQNDNMTVHDCNSFNDKDGSEYTYVSVSNISQSPSHISHNTAAGLDRSPKYVGKLHPPTFNQQKERRQFTKKGSYEHMSEASLGSKDNAGGAKGETVVEEGLGPGAEAGEPRRASLFAGGGESLGPVAGPRASSLGRSEPKTGQEEGQMANVQVLASDATKTGVFQINAATPLQAVDEMMMNKISTRIAKMHSQPHAAVNGRPPVKPEQSAPSLAAETRELKPSGGSPSSQHWNQDHQADGLVSAKLKVPMKQLKRFQSLEAPAFASGDLIQTAIKEHQITEQVDEGGNEQQQLPLPEVDPHVIEENLPQADRESSPEQPTQGQQHQQDPGPDDIAIDAQEPAEQQDRSKTQAFQYIDSRRNPVNDNLKALIVSAGMVAYEASLATQPKASKKKEKNAARWQSLGRDQAKQALQPQESNVNSLQADPKLRAALVGIPLNYEVVALLQPTYFGETYLIAMDKTPSQQHAEASKAAGNTQVQAEASSEALGQNQEIQNGNELEYHILKVLDTSKTLKKEKPAMLKAIGAMMHVEHPAVASYQRFFMSADFFYYISKLKIKCGSEKKSTRIKNFEESKVENTSPAIQSVPPIEQAHANLLNQLGHPLREIAGDLPCTLSEALINYQKTLTLRQIAKIALDLLFAVQFIHSKDIIHLDINLFNILIQARDPCEYLRGKPTKEDQRGQDNGQAAKMDHDGDEQLTNSSQQEDSSNILFINFCQTGQYTKRMRFSAPEEAEIGKGGPLRTSDTSKQHQNQILNINASGISFMSPERLTGNIKPEEVELGKQADIWSIGVIIYLLFVGRLPFKGETCREVYENIKKCEVKFSGSKWARVPDSAKALLAEMLCDDPMGRIDAASAVNHPFFQEVGQDPGVGMGDSEGEGPFKREAIIGKNIQRLLSKLQLVDQICMYHYVLEQSGNLIRAHFSAFASQLAKAKSMHQTVCMEEDSDEEAEAGPIKASSTQLMEQVDGLILQAEEAEIGLSHIMGDKVIAKWFVQQLIKSRRENISSGRAHQQLQGNDKLGTKDQHLLLLHARLAKEANQDVGVNIEHGVKHNVSHEIERIQQPTDDQDWQRQYVTFKELLMFSLDLHLGKIDRQLQRAYITCTEVHDDAAALIKDCLMMALNMHPSHHLLIDHQQGAEPNSFNSLKQLIYLHAVDQLHLAQGENGGLHPAMTDLIFGDSPNGKTVNPNSIKWSQAPSEQ